MQNNFPFVFAVKRLLTTRIEQTLLEEVQKDSLSCASKQAKQRFQREDFHQSGFKYMIKHETRYGIERLCGSIQLHNIQKEPMKHEK